MDYREHFEEETGLIINDCANCDVCKSLSFGICHHYKNYSEWLEKELKEKENEND